MKNHEKIMREEIKTVIQGFLKDRKIKDVEIPEDVLEKIKDYVRFYNNHANFCIFGFV